MTEYLKIKDGVDLQELEKFNYCDMGNCYQRHLDFGVILFVNKSTRIMSRVAPYDCRDIPSNSEIVEIARDYIKKQGGFEKFAEWGLL